MIVSTTLLAASCDDGDIGRNSAPGPPARDSEANGQFVFRGKKCTYEGSTTLPAEDTTFALINHGGTADFDLWRMDEGHEYSELVAHIAKEVRRADAGRSPLGHPGFADLVAEASTNDRGEGTMTASLEPGEYGMACIRFGGNGAFVAAGPFTVE